MARLVGNTIVDNFDNYTGNGFNTRIFGHLPNGTPVDDSLVNDGVIFKNKANLGGGYSVRSEFLESYDVNARWFMPNLSSDNDGIENRIAIQESIITAKLFGIASVLIPAGDYNLDVSVPIIIPSNICIRGIPRCTILRPDVTTLTPMADRPYPLTNSAVFCGGDPATGLRFSLDSGAVTAGLGENITMYGIDIICDYERGTIPNGHVLLGISIFYVDTIQIENCKTYNMPHTGIQLSTCRNFKIINNYCDKNGYGNSEIRTRNGISSGGAQSTSALFPCYNGVISGNQCSFNYDEGVQYGAIRGVVVSNNTCLGNGHLGIEGDTGLNTTQTEEVSGREVASQAIICNNYVDGRKEDGVSFGLGGISFSGGNEGTVTISNNIVRNISGDSGISAFQNNGGLIEISDNLIYNCNPASTLHQISVRGERISIHNNKCYKPGNSAIHNFIFTNGTNEFVSIKDNYCDYISGGFYSGIPQGSTPKLEISGNTWMGGGSRSVRIQTSGPNPVYDYLTIYNNRFYESSGEIQIGQISAATSLSIKKFTILDNDITHNEAIKPNFAITFINMAAGSILKGIVKNNDFGNTWSTTGIYSDKTILLKLYERSNIVGGNARSDLEGTLILTANRTLTDVDFGVNGFLALYVNATSGNLTITCMTAETMIGLTLVVIKTDASANTVTVKGNGTQLINGANTSVLSTQFASGTFKSNGIQLYKLN